MDTVINSFVEKSKEILQDRLRPFKKEDADTIISWSKDESAYHCYKAAGFKDVILDETETYKVMGEEWKCVEMAIER